MGASINPPVTGGGGGGSTAWSAITGKPTEFPPSAHGHTATEANADARGMALAAAAPLGGVVAMFHAFGLGPEGLIHDVPTNGNGTHDPFEWIDARTLVGAPADAVLEECHVVDGVLRHRGTRLVASAAVWIPEAPGHAITMGFTESVPGPGGGYPSLGMPESGYSASRASFVDGVTGNGYVGYVQSADDTANHSFLIVRDTASIPTPIAGPWDVGRRLTDKDCWTFRHIDNTFSILLNGELVGEVTDDTYPASTFASSSIVLNTGSLNLPGVPWWSMSFVDTSSRQAARYPLPMKVAATYHIPFNIAVGDETTWTSPADELVFSTFITPMRDIEVSAISAAAVSASTDDEFRFVVAEIPGGVFGVEWAKLYESESLNFGNFGVMLKSGLSMTLEVGKAYALGVIHNGPPIDMKVSVVESATGSIAYTTSGDAHPRRVAIAHDFDDPIDDVIDTSGKVVTGITPGFHSAVSVYWI